MTGLPRLPLDNEVSVTVQPPFCAISDAARYNRRLRNDAIFEPNPLSVRLSSSVAWFSRSKIDYTFMLLYDGIVTG